MPPIVPTSPCATAPTVRMNLGGCHAGPSAAPQLARAIIARLAACAASVLLLKLAIVPVFLALISLAGRRWGPGIAGLLAGFPVVSAPILAFLTLEQGADFAAQAAAATLSAVIACIAFGVSYAWASRRWRWPRALVVAYLGWFGFAYAGTMLELPAWALLGLTLASIAAGRVCLPRAAANTAPAGGLPRWELGLRMLVGALLVSAVTLAAGSLGVRWSGLFAMFPVLGSVLGVFTQHRAGAAAVATLFRGMFLGFIAFAAFCAVLELTLRQWPPLPAFAVAIAAAVLVQGLVYRQTRRPARRPSELPVRPEFALPQPAKSLRGWCSKHSAVSARSDR